MQQENVINQLEKCYQLYKHFEWLINAYVLDFYTENCWEKLPVSWQEDLAKLDALSIAKLLNFDKELKIKQCLPLSLLALRSFVRNFDVERQPCEITPRKFHEKLEKLLWKHVKPKKQHEIARMAQITYKNSLKTNCNFVVDVGSGLGHLCRNLAYGYGLKVCGIETQKQLGDTAKNLDIQFESFANKIPSSLENITTPIHLNKHINFEINSIEFVNLIKNAFGICNNDFAFGIVALHACGDLSSFLLKLFKNCNQIKFLNIVGCCYMKLTTSDRSGYPLSSYALYNEHDLTYNSREMACHAIENYIERLNNNQYWQLKIHSYRAILEKLLRKNYPEYCQSALSSVKYNEGMTFHEYCVRALKKLNISFDMELTESTDVEMCLKSWNKVVIFYSLRLLMAPIVESIVLLDRYLFLTEFSSGCELIPAFNPKLSPRNHVLSAIK